MGIAIHGAHKAYRSRRKQPIAALTEVDLHVARGELMVVVGPSGSGKSTLLRATAGLEALDAGRIEIGGRDVTTAAPGDRDISLVFQDYALFPHLTVAENIAFGQRARGVPKTQITTDVAQAATMLGLTAALARYPRELSGGERQRVALARAMIRRPKAFLLDEPLASLDPDLRLRTRAEIRELQRRLGVSMLYVTHDQTEALALGDRIAVVRAGRIEQVGTPDELYSRPSTAFIARFIGTLPMNLLPPEALGRENGPVTGIRPERTHLAHAGHGHLTGRIAAVEPSGEETVLHVVCPDTTRILVRVPSSDGVPRPGSETGITWSNADEHHFASAEGPRTA
ncbi:ABC transporter ATP-binding protein [Streptomyces sp. NBC_00841]|uniref:ABC transporter ATP-binding protein n=1 Tax=unclassified Streptomyces TaxID=2593676 RepID=UPI002257C785|nr:MULTISPECIES: ABC transporter ATP-binding protein [unclassified Streptomyces]MCX4531558.1 ABC transporter ATP-binding protein [Streptomyces sp. NBC_01669]WSA02871.1 ABC transporter ATP-binding protein [Streptomyces sp. NBC_00841]